VILAGDVGGTKILLEVGEVRSGRWEAALSRRYLTAEADDFFSLVAEFLGEWNKTRVKGQRITGAAFGVAGPAEDNRVKMTHRAWIVDAAKISSRFLIPDVTVVNDLVAAAYGIAWLGPRDLVTVQTGKSSPMEPRVVLGVGTGLGIAYLIPAPDGSVRALPGEGGHAGFAPATFRQAELWRSIFAAHGRVAAEDVCSGKGLTHVFAFLSGETAHRPGVAEDQITPEWISRTAIEKTDPCSAAALELFVECLGNVAGDHALSTMARGGVYLTGGVTSRIVSFLIEGRFSEAFCSKGAHSAMMMKIPVRAVRNERVALLGAARIAAEK
jgi:glucokinase